MKKSTFLLYLIALGFFAIRSSSNFVEDNSTRVLRSIASKISHSKPSSASKKRSNQAEGSVPSEAPPRKKGILSGFLNIFKGSGASKSRISKGSSPISAGVVEAATTGSDVRKFRYIDARTLEAGFAEQIKIKGIRSVLIGKAQFIIDTAKAHGIDPVFFAAAICFETGWGTSYKIRNKNNPGGLTGGGGKYSSFKSIEAGIEQMAVHLRAGYIDVGRTTPSSIASKYAPVGAGNDPNGTNRQWPGTVRSIMNRLMTESVNRKGS